MCEICVFCDGGFGGCEIPFGSERDGKAHCGTRWGAARGGKEQQSQPSRGFLQWRRFENNGLFWFPDVIVCVSLCQILFYFLELASYIIILYNFNKSVSLVNIFYQLLNSKDYFDIRTKDWGPIWHSWKVEDYFDTKVIGWGPKWYLNKKKKYQSKEVWNIQHLIVIIHNIRWVQVTLGVT